MLMPHATNFAYAHTHAHTHILPPYPTHPLTPPPHPLHTPSHTSPYTHPPSPHKDINMTFPCTGRVEGTTTITVLFHISHSFSTRQDLNSLQGTEIRLRGRKHCNRTVDESGDSGSGGFNASVFYIAIGSVMQACFTLLLGVSVG